MMNLRRHLLALVLATAAALSACGPTPHAGLGPDVHRELHAAEDAVERWMAADRAGSLPDDVVISLGYVERLRLGLGSPFRLAEMALRDPRLGEASRREVAWALLARTLEGEAYEIDAVALDRAGVAGIASWPGLGRHHLALIEGAIAEARDPRSGELAVRLAYRLAAMEGSLPERAPVHATRAAALIRDRELARRDVERLLRSAEAVQGDPLAAISQWRGERWLLVEQPAMTPLTANGEREALEQAPRLAQALRQLGPRLGDVTERRQTLPDVNPSLLSDATAARLAALADSLNMPPQAPVAIAARTYREELMQQPWLTAEERARRESFTELADEERFVAGYAQLVRRSPHDAAPSLAALWAAVALRAYAQEPVWFPGFGGPTTRQLQERFGLASVEYAPGLPAEWRPYYRGMLQLALQDMQRVLPALDVRGLTVRFGSTPGTQTLAMHDPKRRRLLLPPASSAGTIAHEVAHDLDWQVALRRYRVKGDYATDRAERAGDRLAVRVRSLVQDAAMHASGDERARRHALRPAENFARAIDWFVASSLAAEGRQNGYLSSIQDEVLTGYGTVRTPDASGRAGDAIVNILDEVAPLYPETRMRFLRSYGSRRAQSPLDLVSAIADIETSDAARLRSADPAALFTQVDAARDRGFAAIDAWSCGASGVTYDSRLEQARRTLVTEATAARARGLALAHARDLAGDAGARWVARQLYGGPWTVRPLEPAVEDALGALVVAARAAGTVNARADDGFVLMAQGCGAW